MQCELFFPFEFKKLLRFFFFQRKRYLNWPVTYLHFPLTLSWVILTKISNYLDEYVQVFLEVVWLVLKRLNQSFYTSLYLFTIFLCFWTFFYLWLEMFLSKNGSQITHNVRMWDDRGKVENICSISLLRIQKFPLYRTNLALNFRELIVNIIVFNFKYKHYKKTFFY